MKYKDMEYDCNDILYTPNGKEHFAVEKNEQIVTWEGNVYEKNDVMSKESFKDALAKFRFE